MSASALLVALGLAAAPAAAQEGPPASTERVEEGAAEDRPIAASVDVAVDRTLQRRGADCPAPGPDQKPCFPASVEVPAKRFSVIDSLNRWNPAEGPAENSGALRPGSDPGTATAGASFDPVCAVRALKKLLKGRNDTYYLYRVWTPSGETAVLRDRPLGSSAYTRSLLGYELIDEIHGECSALKAWLRAQREARQANEDAGPPQ